MKKILELRIFFALMFVAAPFVAMSQTTFFNDTFASGSTLNQPVAPPTPTATSYETLMGLDNSTSSIAPSDLNITLPNSGSVLGEVFALFTNTPVPLTAPGDYLALTVVFINTSNILSSTLATESANASLNIGLFDSGGVDPNQGNITSSSGSATGGTQNWLGYIGRIFYNSKPSILARTAQASSGTTSQNQDLLFSGASSSQAFNSPNGLAVGSPNNTTNITLNLGTTYTAQFVVSFATPTSLAISNALYVGAGTGGQQLFCMTNIVATNNTFITGGFDGFAIGVRSTANLSQPAIMDITSVKVTGQSTPVTSPPTIISQSGSVALPSGASCAFNVNTIGFGQHWQWYRHGAALTDGGNISGSTTRQLTISPAGPSDVQSGANGYYCTITGTGNYSTNTTNCDLTLLAASTNLTWTGLQATWDLNNTAAWQDPNSITTVFNYGDPVNFTDFGGGGGITLTGDYLSPASITVNSSATYNFSSASSGHIAGPATLYYVGPGQLTVGNGNNYTGGTIISNTPAGKGLLLQNLTGLGTGPVVAALAGGKLEIVPAGGASSALNNDLIITNDFTITYDGLGTYAGVLNGNITLPSGKLLTFNALTGNTTTNQRVRIYGTNTLNGNLLLNSSLLTLAPYNGSGNQTYNGIISGDGGIIQRGAGNTILNGLSTYTGGTIPSAGAIGFGIDTVGAVTSGPIGVGPLLLTTETGNTAGSGEVFAYGGARTIANSIVYPSATNNLILIVGGTNNLTFTGSVALNGADGLGNNTTRTLQVTNTGLTTISGVISDGGFGYGLIKTGNGILALAATETYTGPTTNSGGTLWVNGQLDAASAVVVTNSTLGGTGKENGSVTLQSGGNLTPGTNVIGTNSIGGNLILSGGALAVRVNRSGFASDQANVSGTITAPSTSYVIVTNVGATLQVGDTFHVLNKAMASGAANVYIGGGGATWVNNLGSDGTIKVATLGVPSISTAVSGPTLTLSWPAAFVGWQVQSNTVGVLSTSWHLVPGTGSTTTYNVTVDQSHTNVFYRLVFP